MYSENLGLISIYLSEKYFDIITHNNSSVGRLIPKLTKLLALEDKSFNEKFIN